MERSGLVPVNTISESPLLSSKQKEVLGRAVFNYLHGKQFQITPKSVEVGGAVVLDALNRGLAAFGKTELAPQDGVTKYVKRGLELREAIRREARPVVEEAIRFDFCADYFGPFALPSSLVNSARQEIAAAFYLTANITNSERIVNLRQERMEELDSLVSMVISKLPQDIQENARHREMGVSEKAKLVRNYIASIVFRENESPIITIDDLMEFNSRFVQNPAEYFGEDSFSKLESQSEYMRGLFEQACETFKSSSTISFESRARLFSTFSRGLLLLDPVLEEEPIIVDPARRGEGVLSLWDRGMAINVDGFLIPKPDALMAAGRQAQASRNSGSHARFREAIHTWNHYQLMKEQLPPKVEGLSKQLASQRAIVDNLESKRNFADPKEDLSLVDVRVDWAQRDFSSARESLNLNRDSIARARSRAHRLAIFKNQVAKNKDSDSPIRIPRDVYLELLTSKAGSLGRSVTILESRLARNKRRGFYFLATFGFNWSEDERIEGKLSYIEKSFNDVRTGEISSIFGDNYRDFIPIIRSELRKIVNNPNYRKLVGLADLTDSEISRLKTFLTLDITHPEVLKTVSLSLLGNPAARLRAPALMEEKLTNLKDVLFQRHQEMDRYRGQDVPDPVASREDIDQLLVLYREARIASIPTKLGHDSEAAAKHLVQFRRIDSLLAILPPMVDKTGFGESLLEYLENGTLRYKRKGFLEKARQEVAKIFLDLLDSSILALDYAEGMRTSRYLELLSRRSLLLFRYFQIPELRQKHDEASEKLERITGQRKLVLERLNLKHLEAEYHHLTVEYKPEVAFLRRMTELGFAVPASPDN